LPDETTATTIATQPAGSADSLESTLEEEDNLQDGNLGNEQEDEL
jgi:hypothetical protein